MSRKHLAIAGLTALLCATGAGTALAAPGDNEGRGNARGHLVLVNDGEETVLPPGQAVRVALDLCADLDLEVDLLNVGLVRDATDPVQVCDGVQLRTRD